MELHLFDMSHEVERLPLAPEKIPYSFLIRLADRTYRFTFKLNITAGFFTVDLETMAGEVLAYGDIVRYGRPLFAPVEDERFPLPVIIPLAPGGESEVTRENFGRTVKLYLFKRERHGGWK
jgi:hypothetical protein